MLFRSFPITWIEKYIKKKNLGDYKEKTKVWMDDNVVFILMCLYSVMRREVWGREQWQVLEKTGFQVCEHTQWTNSNINKFVDKS